MSSAALGVDLLQQVARVCRTPLNTDAPAPVAAGGPAILPAVVLPVFRGEPAIFGPAAVASRCGIGLRWPPSAQVPCRGQSGRGVGRIPLLAAWERLGDDDWDAPAGHRREEFTWRPHDGSDQRSPGVEPAEAIVESSLAFSRPNDGDYVTVVVPDSYQEASLQLLKDALVRSGRRSDSEGRIDQRYNLLWRSAALAMAWCERFAGEWSSLAIEPGATRDLGHIAVVSLGMDCFEVSVCGILLEGTESGPKLVPIVDRNAGPFRIGPWGSSLLASVHGPEGAGPLWRAIVGSTWPSEVLTGGATPAGEWFQEVHLDGLGDRLSDLRSEHDHLEHILIPFETDGSASRVFFPRVIGGLSRQRSRGPLGVVVDGALSQLRIGTRMTLADLVTLGMRQRSTAYVARCLVGEGCLAARGAALFGGRLSRGEPTYRERVIPIAIFAVGRDKLGDPEARWTRLVDKDTIPAGIPFRRHTPLDQFQFSAGTQDLELVLRRRNPRDRVMEYKMVPASLDQVATRDHKVRLDVTVNPGQGYPLVEVISREGLFRKELDWTRMHDSEEPTIQLSYVSQVWRVRPKSKYWSPDRVDAFRKLAHEGADDSKLYDALKKLRDGNLNQRHRPDRHDWIYEGAIGSDGTPAGKEAVFNGLRRVVVDLYQTRRDSKLRNELIRASGWMYVGMPAELQAIVRKRVADVVRAEHSRSRLQAALDDIGDADLTAAGHAFTEPKDIRLLFEATRLRLLSSPTGINDWLRALRNLVQYRQHTLHPEGVGTATLDTIAEKVVDALSEQQEIGNYKLIFDNCQRILIFLLKRRRYKPGFLSEGERLTRRIDRRMDMLARATRTNDRGDGHPKPYQCEWARLILRFLRKSATADDVTRFLELVE